MSTIDPKAIESINRVYGGRIASALSGGGSGLVPQLNQVLNTRPDPIDQRDFIYRSSLAQLPAGYINEGCLSHHLLVRSQGNEGSCVGQSIASLIDLQNISRERSEDTLHQPISARFLYQNARLYDHEQDYTLPGSSLRGAIKGFYHNGACTNDTAPYIPKQKQFRINSAMRTEAKAVSLGTYYRLRHVLNSYHCALLEADAILCSAIIHDGWGKDCVLASEQGEIKYPYYKKGRKKNPCRLRGGHAFVIVGYDESGFFVLNSWGDSWGQYPVSELPSNEAGDISKTHLPGIAHWSYNDWADNVLDAWILRLSAPTGRGTGFVGGRSSLIASKESKPRAARKRDVQGHYLHVSDGVLVNEPPYENDLADIDEIAQSIVDDPKIHSLMFFAHGGLSTLDASSARAAAMIPTFLENGIYPIFYFWRTGFGEMLGSILEGIVPEDVDKSHDYAEIRDNSIERLIRPIGRAIWNDVRRNAESCFSKAKDTKVCDEETSTGGTAWDATKKLLDACAGKQSRHPMKIHFVSHSAGVFMLCELFKRLASEKKLDSTNIATINIMSPCCRTSYLNDNIFEHLGNRMDNRSISVFNLSQVSEQSMDPDMAPYGKSLPCLVSNAFYDERPTSIAAMDEFWKADIEPYLKKEGIRSVLDYVLSGDIDKKTKEFRSKASYHGGFDNDADTMNTILKKIIGSSRSKNFDAELRGFNEDQLNRGNF
jgi:hypothetical protein